MRGFELVVKCGSAALDRDAVLDDVARLAAEQGPLVLVHGGRTQVGQLAAELGRTPEYLRSVSGTGFWRTDGQAMDTLLLALAGRVKPALVAALVLRGVPAVGLTGVDAGLVRAEPKPALKVVRGGKHLVLRGDLSGNIRSVRTDLLDALASAGIVPVVSPPALGPRGPLNVDSDRVAAAIAGSVQAKALVILTGVAGVLADGSDGTEVVRRAEPEALMHAATGGMRHKLRAASEALGAGVARVVIADARVTRPVRNALAGENCTVLELRGLPRPAE